MSAAIRPIVQTMDFQWTEFLPFGLGLAGALCAVLFVAGGMRFRRWAVEDRPGIPRYSETGETVFLWVLYSGLVALIIVLVKQTFRHL